ncbi:hypothetical protein D3C80_649770 [compost metagenome]
MAVGFRRKLGIDFLMQQPRPFLQRIDIMIDRFQTADQSRCRIIETIRHLVLVGSRGPSHQGQHRS